MNLAVVIGTLSSEPRRRDLPSGSVLVSYEVTTEEPDRRCTVPVVWFDPARPPSLADGDEVVVVGRVRRRFFRSGGSTVSRTEVEARVVARAGSRRADRALAAAHETLGESVPCG